MFILHNPTGVDYNIQLTLVAHVYQYPFGWGDSAGSTCEVVLPVGFYAYIAPQLHVGPFYDARLPAHSNWSALISDILCISSHRQS